MAKKIMSVIMTNKNKDQIVKQSSDRDALQTAVMEDALKDWYLNNKEKIGELEEESIVHCDYKVDEETEKIYKLFIRESMKNLLNQGDKNEK